MQILDKLSSLGSSGAAGIGPMVAAHGPMVVSGVLVVAIAAQLATVVWQVLAPPPSAGPGQPAVAAGPAPGVNVPGIVNAHLFGTALAPATGDPANAPATSLSLVLAGTIAGADPKSGWAIIGETAQSARVYVTGATLPGGASLREVYADRVILDRGGRMESLPLPRLSGGAGPVQVGFAPPGAAAPEPTLADNIRQFVAQDPQAVSEILRPQPVFAGGQQRGYRVYPGRNRAQFAKLGLMPGDLVTAVNGTPLDDPNRGLETLRGVGAGSPVVLTVERGGQTQQVTVDPAAAMAEVPVAPDPQQPAPEDE
jgi:general secretion pathway protein C